LTETSIDALIVRQALVITVIIIIVYFMRLRKTKGTKNADSKTKSNVKANLKG
jgi:preprotein translocase subunit YajC